MVYFAVCLPKRHTAVQLSRKPALCVIKGIYMQNEHNDQLTQLTMRLREFAQARDWEQFHSPKNLSMALIAEAAELVEHFQWLTQQQSYELNGDKYEQVRMELADIFIFLLRIADRLNVDLIQAACDKIDVNERRYPVERVKGDARRASEYED